MVLAMKFRRVLGVLLCAAVALAAGCGGGGSDNPFEGTWISENSTRITFTGKNWSDSEGDEGTYSFTGEDPLYTVTFETVTRRYTRQATFADDDTLELCVVNTSGSVGTCVNLVRDRPTLH